MRIAHPPSSRPFALWSRSLVCLCLVWFAGCNGPTQPTSPFDTDVVLQPNQVVAIEESSLRIKFVGVTADSRCPGDALCLVAGDATVVIEVGAPRGAVSRYDLHTSAPQSVVHGSAQISLRELAPYPFSSRPKIEPLDYRATIRVSRLN